MTKTVWAIARQMISEGIRMKVAVVFLILMGMLVLGLPFSIRGDSSISGAVQSFLTYALSGTGVLLGMLTIFLSRSLSDEFVNRQLYLVMTKPVPRWQYILGKWLGITVLNLAFLVFGGMATYGMVYYIRQAHKPLDKDFDLAELNNEVLVARHAISCALPDFTRPAEQEFQKNLEEGMYQNLPGHDAGKERGRLAKKYEARWRVVEPLGTRVFTFENVLTERSPKKTVQLRYKTNISNYPPDEVYRALWSFGDPLKGTPVYDAPVRHVIDRFHTVRFPADAVAEDHTLQIVFYNRNPYADEREFRSVIEFRKGEGPEVLFVVGSFGWNLARLLTLMFCKLMFLGAVAVLMVTLFSFPVACLTSFTVYILAGARSFIADALDTAADPNVGAFESVKEFATQAIVLLMNAVTWVVPDFSYYDAVETFVNGQNVSLVWVLQGIGELGLLKTTIVLGLAMLFFYRREVAELSF